MSTTDLTASSDYETTILASRRSEADEAIAAIAAEFEAENPPEDPVVEAAPAGTPQADLETPKPEAVRTEAPKAEDTDRGMLRLLERESQVRDREAALERKVADIEAKYANPPKTDIRGAIEADPIKFFTDAGLEPEQVSRLIIAAKLGDKTPEDIRKALGDYPLKKELRELREMIQQRDAQAEVSKVRMQASDFVGKPEGTSKYPALTAVAKVDSKAAAEAVFDEIARDAQVRNLPLGGPYLTYEEAAAKVDAKWELYRKAFTPSPNATAPAEIAPTGASTPKTETKPATKPRAPAPRKPYWESDTDWEAQKDAAIAEAVAQYRAGR
jgi:hypothetical protein